MPDAANALQIIGIITTLEPAAFALVAALAAKLNGKSDAEVLAEDADTWTSVVATAHAEQQ